MQRINKPIAGLILVLTTLLITSMSQAAPEPIKLLPETVQLRFSELSGFTLAQQKCVICHSSDYISYQPPKMNQTQWTQEVIKMQHTYGAPLNDSESKSIGAYLAVVYGTAKASDAEVIAVSNAIELLAVDNAETNIQSDLQILLKKHACFGCHAIDKNLIGPAFSNIASQYKDNPQAQARLVASFENGSVGKWGQVAMPAIRNLSDAQANALAQFVLQH